MPGLVYRFEELPLHRADGVGCIEVSGTADIDYDDDGVWSIERIVLDGSEPRRVTRIPLAYSAEPTSWWQLVAAALRRERSEAIDAEIWSEMAPPSDLYAAERPLVSELV